MHVDSVLMYLRRETYLCDIARLLISFERNGMHFSFYNFFWGGAGRRCLAHSAGVRGERRKVRAARNAGWRRRQIQERPWNLLSFPLSP